MTRGLAQSSYKEDKKDSIRGLIKEVLLQAPENAHNLHIKNALSQDSSPSLEESRTSDGSSEIPAGQCTPLLNSRCNGRSPSSVRH